MLWVKVKEEIRQVASYMDNYVKVSRSFPYFVLSSAMVFFINIERPYQLQH